MTTGRVGWCVGLAVVLFGPALAQAQLFPNLPIKRQRPSMDEEAPIYSQYRRQYFGYFPTCWRRFPPGWGCPTPEAIDWDTIQREDPVRMRRDLEATLPQPANGGQAGGAGPQPGGPAPGVPAVPTNTPSPFDMDDLPVPDAAPPPGAAPAPEAAPALPPPGGVRSPFDPGGQARQAPADSVRPAAYRPSPTAPRPRASAPAQRATVELGLNEDTTRRRR
jgi:hypothetical protein